MLSQFRILQNHWRLTKYVCLSQELFDVAAAPPPASRSCSSGLSQGRRRAFAPPAVSGRRRRERRPEGTGPHDLKTALRLDGLTIAAAIASANAQLDLADEGPLPAQAAALLSRGASAG